MIEILKELLIFPYCGLKKGLFFCFITDLLLSIITAVSYYLGALRCMVRLPWLLPCFVTFTKGNNFCDLFTVLHAGLEINLFCG